jgi:hypothetical protein
MIKETVQDSCTSTQQRREQCDPVDRLKHQDTASHSVPPALVLLIAVSFTTFVLLLPGLWR